MEDSSRGRGEGGKGCSKCSTLGFHRLPHCSLTLSPTLYPPYTLMQFNEKRVILSFSLNLMSVCVCFAAAASKLAVCCRLLLLCLCVLDLLEERGSKGLAAAAFAVLVCKSHYIDLDCFSLNEGNCNFSC